MIRYLAWAACYSLSIYFCNRWIPDGEVTLFFLPPIAAEAVAFIAIPRNYTPFRCPLAFRGVLIVIANIVRYYEWALEYVRANGFVDNEGWLVAVVMAGFQLAIVVAIDTLYFFGVGMRVQRAAPDD